MNPRRALPARLFLVAATACLAHLHLAAAEPAWPTYHGDYALTGRATTSAPAAPVVRWRFRADAGIDQPPVIGRDHAYFTTAKGTVYAVTLAGVESWRRTLGDSNASASVSAPALLVSNLVVIGTEDGRLHALDAATGRTQWQQSIGGAIRGSPNAARGAQGQAAVIALSQPDGVLACLHLDDGRVLWQSAKTQRSDGAPAVADAWIAYGNCDSTLQLVSPADGRTLAAVPLGEDCQVAGGVAILGAMAFCGTRGGKVVAVDLRASSITWSHTNSSGEVFSTPAVSPDITVFGSADGCLYAAATATGAPRWQYAAGEAVSSPVLAGDRVIATAGGRLFALALADGAPLWTRDVGDAITAPALGDGLILVGADDGNLTALGDAP